ncbi:hypothetical protein SAMN04488135_104384 [Pollutimonas bauzanensis]|uniref:Uncharacterized protein n=1 Tax=Pollutimonas bauzanensis TaxID=658167 RepID=A0A1M5VH65_9BURK|nr:hypothetical protein SAMN04488135_104384 [Pollutimonas bauzanensis]
MALGGQRPNPEKKRGPSFGSMKVIAPWTPGNFDPNMGPDSDDFDCITASVSRQKFPQLQDIEQNQETPMGVHRPCLTSQYKNWKISPQANHRR